MVFHVRPRPNETHTSQYRELKEKYNLKGQPAISAAFYFDVALRTFLATKWVHQLFPQESARLWANASSIDAKWLPRHRISMAYWLTPLSRVFLEKLTGFQLVKNFPAFYWTRRFITAFISARHLSLSWASSIQSRPPHPTSWRYILIFSYHLHLGLPSDLFPSVFPTKTLYTPLLSPNSLHAPPKLFFSLLSPEKYWVRSTDQ